MFDIPSPDNNNKSDRISDHLHTKILRENVDPPQDWYLASY